ncbi:MAG: EamA family transporter [Candidatus Woesearchaeota archaeon]
MLWVALTLGSAFLLSLRDIGSKRIVKNREDSFKLVFVEAFVGLLVTLFVFNYSIQFQQFFNYSFLFLLKGVTATAAMLFFLKLIEDHEISSVAPLMNLSPAILLILSILVLSETLSILQIAGIFVIIIGTIVFESAVHKGHVHKDHAKHFFEKDTRFFVYVLLMLLALSGNGIIDKYMLSQGVSVQTQLFYTFFFITLFVPIFAYKHIKHALTYDRIGVSIFGIVSTYLVLFAIAMPSTLISLVVPLRRTSTFMTAIFGGVLLHESHMKLKILSILIMLTGVLLLVM